MNLIQPIVYILTFGILLVPFLLFIVQMPLIFLMLILLMFIALFCVNINMPSNKLNCQKWNQERNLFVIPNINSNKVSGENKNQSRRKKLFHLMEPEF